MSQPERIIVGDVGGTNVRFAVVEGSDRGSGELPKFRSHENDSFSSFEEALEKYFRSENVDRPDHGLFALAGPIKNNAVHLTNRKWTVSADTLVEKFGFKSVRLVNDYAAMARSIPELPDSAFKPIHEGETPSERLPVLVAGPGTGLGIATLLPAVSKRWKVITGEGGHSAFAASSDKEWELAKVLRRKFGYVSRELVLSGSSLDEVHKAICKIHGVEYEQMEPAEIMERARNNDHVCSDVCEIRAGALLETLGDIVLINGTLGGVVITGGVAERLFDFLKDKDLLERFFSRGKMSPYLEPVNIKLLQYSKAPLFGAIALYDDGI